MSENKIHLSSSPHFTEGLSTQKVMLMVIISMLPECIAGVIFFGAAALVRILVSVISCVAFEALFQKITKDKIRVNAVAPGVTRTDMLSALPQEMVDRISAGIPLGRVGEPLDIANAYFFLASELSSYVTGITLRVDGAAMT